MPSSLFQNHTEENVHIQLQGSYASCLVFFAYFTSGKARKVSMVIENFQRTRDSLVSCACFRPTMVRPRKMFKIGVLRRLQIAFLNLVSTNNRGNFFHFKNNLQKVCWTFFRILRFSEGSKTTPFSDLLCRYYIS